MKTLNILSDDTLTEFIRCGLCSHWEQRKPLYFSGFCKKEDSIFADQATNQIQCCNKFDLSDKAS